MHTLSPRRPRALHTVTVGVICAALVGLFAAHAALVQAQTNSEYQPLSDPIPLNAPVQDPSPVDDTPGENVAETNMMLYRDETIPKEQRTGNCCEPYSAVRTGGQCLWGVTDPTYRSDAEQILDCEGIGGISYEKTKWSLCNAQCGRRLGLWYCSPNNNYTCQQPGTLSEGDEDAFAGGDGFGYQEKGMCETRCVAPFDPQVSVACSCADGYNYCDVLVLNNGRTPGTLNQLTVSLTWANASATIGPAFTSSEADLYRYDDQNEYQVLETWQPIVDGNVMTFVQQDATRASEAPRPVVMPPLSGFWAQVYVEAPQTPSDPYTPAPTGGTVTALVSARNDPTTDNNVASARVTPVDRCQEMTVSRECMVSQGITWHTYSVAIPPPSNPGDRVIVEHDFSNAPYALAGDEPNTIDMVAAAPGCIADPGNLSVTCTVEKEADREPSRSVSFQVRVDSATAAGTDIRHTATVTELRADSAAATPISTNETTIIYFPCSECALCNSCYVTRDGSMALDGSGQPVACDQQTCETAPPYFQSDLGSQGQLCTYVPPLTGGAPARCVPNVSNNYCDAWYVCCEKLPSLSATQPLGRLFVAGRIGRDTDVDAIYPGGVTMNQVEACRALPPNQREFTQILRERPVVPDDLEALILACERYPDTLVVGDPMGDPSRYTDPVAGAQNYICSNKIERAPLGGNAVSQCFDFPGESALAAQSIGKSPPASLDDFTVFMSNAYNKFDGAADVDPAKLSCSGVCAEAKTQGTCCAADACQENTSIEVCRGNMFYAHGGPDAAQCNADRQARLNQANMPGYVPCIGVIGAPPPAAAAGQFGGGGGGPVGNPGGGPGGGFGAQQ